MGNLLKQNWNEISILNNDTRFESVELEHMLVLGQVTTYTILEGYLWLLLKIFRTVHIL